MNTSSDVEFAAAGYTFGIYPGNLPRLRTVYISMPVTIAVTINDYRPVWTGL